MASKRPQLEVRPGLNVWRLLRTDRDVTEPDNIPQHAAAAMNYFLAGGLSPIRNQHLVRVGKNEWRFGNLLPLQVLEISRRAGPAMPMGEVLADRVTTVPGTIPTVKAKKPWWVLVRFWWRGPRTVIDYPGVTMGWVSPHWALNGADWVLDRAVFVPEGTPATPPDPGAQKWAEALGDKAEAAFLRATDVDLGALLGDLGMGFGILVLLYFLSQKNSR